MPANGRRRADDALLAALASGETIEAAAAKAGVSEATVYRRLKDPGFAARLDTVKSELVARSTAALSAAGTRAVQTLLDLQKDAAPPAVRLGAARAVLELGNRMRAEVDLAGRVEAIEQALGLRDERGTP